MLLKDENRAYYRIKEMCNGVARTQRKLKELQEGTDEYKYAKRDADSYVCDLCTICRVFWFDECAILDWATLHGEGCFEQMPIKRFVQLFEGTFGKARDILEEEFNHTV